MRIGGLWHVPLERSELFFIGTMKWWDMKLNVEA
jgi:hypothetical protein